MSESQSIQSKIVACARSHVGSSEWRVLTCKKSADGKVQFNVGEPKCNLFVYEVLVGAGVGQYLPNKPGFLGSIFNQLQERPYTAGQWYEGQVPHTELVGTGEDGLNKCQPGDIVTNGNHIGIITEPHKTVSASSKDNAVVENDWAWRKDEYSKVKIYRVSDERKIMQEETARVDAEKEAARFAEREVARISEREATRVAVEKEAARFAEREAARIPKREIIGNSCCFPRVCIPPPPMKEPHFPNFTYLNFPSGFGSFGF